MHQHNWLTKNIGDEMILYKFQLFLFNNSQNIVYFIIFISIYWKEIRA